MKKINSCMQACSVFTIEQTSANFIHAYVNELACCGYKFSNACCVYLRVAVLSFGDCGFEQCSTLQQYSMVHLSCHAFQFSITTSFDCVYLNSSAWLAVCNHSVYLRGWLLTSLYLKVDNTKFNEKLESNSYD